MEINDVREHFRFLGRRVRDRLTGFKGVGGAVVVDISGCVQTLVRPSANSKTGELAEGVIFDNNRLEFEGKERVMPLPESLAPLFVKGAKAVEKGGANVPGMRHG